MEDNVAIRESDLSVTISNMQSCYDLISKSLNNASSVIATICAGVDGEISTEIKNKYSYFENEYDMILNNLESYIEDMKKVLSSFNSEESNISVNEIEKNEGGELIHVNS